MAITIEELAAKVAGLEQQMAAITVPPTEYYTSIFSGEEIDAAIKKVNDGIVGGVSSFNGRSGVVVPQAGDYNATQIPVSGEPEAGSVAAALSNKAPAGYGFGDALQSIETTSAEESYETYCAKVDAVLDGMPDRTAKLVLAYPPAVYGSAKTTVSLLYKGDANYAVLSNIGSSDVGLCGWRMFKLRYPSSSSPSVWMPFEWEHPPIKIGVEYRTTERYGDSPIYVKAVDCGQIADGKEVQHGIANINIVIRYQGMRTGLSMPQVYNKNLGDPWSAYVVSVNQTRISLSCGESASGGNCAVILWYTKTTD